VNDIVTIEIDNPPLNTLSSHIVRGVYSALKDLPNTGVTAVVLTSKGGNFSAGADITEFGGSSTEGPHLPDLCNLLATFKLPIIAALQGVTLGGGCEVALACHARLAAPSVRIGLPEVKLGLLPAHRVAVSSNWPSSPIPTARSPPSARQMQSALRG
jgi:3-hydroxyacyl-CoA dehydrogenase